MNSIAKTLPLALLLVTPFDPSLFADESCLAAHFFGNYRDGPTMRSVMIPDAHCLDSWTARNVASSASISEASREIQQLVWLEEQAVDESLKATFPSEFDAFLGRLSNNIPSTGGQEVLAFSKGSSNYELLYQTPSAALISLDRDTARTIDTILPRFWRSTLLPTSPVSYIPVSTPAVDRVKRILAKLAFDPVVADLVDDISISQMKKDVRFLTGEDGKSGIVSRHSFSDGALFAATWLKEQFEGTGAKCELRRFLTGFSPNVICRYPSAVKTNATVLFSAHYDSRGSFGLTRAPGGDDDGSGTTAILAVARAIARNHVQFRSNVELVAFAGEEQGLFGSKAYSRDLRAANADLILMVQSDMLAYHVEGEPMQLGLPDIIGTPEVAQLITNISAIYSPELHVGLTSACCSDHQPFVEQGFPAAQLFERAGPIADPMYHNSGDLSDRAGYDFNQLKSIAKVQFATLLHAAGYEIRDAAAKPLRQF